MIISDNRSIIELDSINEVLAVSQDYEERVDSSGSTTMIYLIHIYYDCDDDEILNPITLPYTDKEERQNMFQKIKKSLEENK